MSKILVGPEYDSVGNMSEWDSVYNAAKISKSIMFLHVRASHRIHLALSSSLSISSVKNSLGVIYDIINLFRNNVFADQTLKIYISKHIPESIKETNWLAYVKRVS